MRGGEREGVGVGAPGLCTWPCLLSLMPVCVRPCACVHVCVWGWANSHFCWWNREILKPIQAEGNQGDGKIAFERLVRRGPLVTLVHPPVLTMPRACCCARSGHGPGPAAASDHAA
jgi:hypothetical protein